MSPDMPPKLQHAYKRLCDQLFFVLGKSLGVKLLGSLVNTLNFIKKN